MLPLRENTSKRKRYGQSDYIYSGAFESKLVILLLFIAFSWLAITLFILPSTLDNQRSVHIPQELSPKLQVVHEKKIKPEFGQQTTSSLTLTSIRANLESFLRDLHQKYADIPPGPTPKEVWEMYKESVERWLVPMDLNNRGISLFPVREDDSIFVSIVSYRDENCANTLREMYSKADHPDRVFVGLVQQNCVENCRSGVLEGGSVIDVDPDDDCYEIFCNSPEGRGRCGDGGQIRHLFANESESLGPAVARYLASKLWHGENYFMQIDSHSLFASGWDSYPITDIEKTPSYPHSVLTQYPPDKNNPSFEKPASRICGAKFADSDIESQIIRLTVSDRFEKSFRDIPCYAPFVGAGYVFAHASFLSVMPFDPYPAWVFMGEEIMFSLRLYTWGYDIYSPTHNTVSHFYVRRHKPKFWEEVGRLFKKPGIHNSIQMFIINRVKFVIGYPESSREEIDESLLANIDLYGVGPHRPLAEYMSLVGLDPMSKEAHRVDWCYKCESPRSVLPVPLTAL